MLSIVKRNDSDILPGEQGLDKDAFEFGVEDQEVRIVKWFPR